MSEIDAISSSLPSLTDQIINMPDSISDPVQQYVESSSSIEELDDKLKILEKANNGQNAELIASINRIHGMIQNNASLSEIKSTFS